MSNPFSASENTSPVSLVRPFDERPTTRRYVSSTPETQPEAVTSPGFALPSRAKTFSSLYATPAFEEPAPQLSERDSIFATHYLAADSAATTPRLPVIPDSKNGLQQLHHNDAITLKLSEPLLPHQSESSLLLYKTRSSSSIASLSSVNNPYSPEGDSKLKPRPFQVTNKSSGASGRAEPERTLEVLEKRNTPTSVHPFSPKPPSYFSRAKSHGALSNTRMSAAWSQVESSARNSSQTADEPSRARVEATNHETRNHSTTRGHVEKRIEATLANAEPTSNARSRKASHYLRLFKENTSSSDQNGQEKSKESSGKSNGTTNLRESSTGRLDIHNENAEDNDDAITIDGRAQPGGRGISDSHAVVEDSTDVEQHPSSENMRQPQPSRTVPNDVMVSRPMSDVSDHPFAEDEVVVPETKRKNEPPSELGLPLRLLDEIRNHHNLTPPFHDRFKSSHARIPGREAGFKDVSTAGNVGHPMASEVLASEDYDGDDYESDKEQISSALYYPHQAPSPDLSGDVDVNGTRGFLESTPVRPEPSGLGQVDEEIQSHSEDVDIALQSEDHSRYLHGDLQRPRTTSADHSHGKLIESGMSSASESDYESLDDATGSVQGESSSVTDGGDLTPTATPNLRGDFLQSKFHKSHRSTAAPLGAVELKPYKHQVGGHTTVFRFSKRAVCKELSNRENEFYEVVERRHPELLRFLPR